jgi:hypothetical protein
MRQAERIYVDGRMDDATPDKQVSFAQDGSFARPHRTGDDQQRFRGSPEQP